MASAAGYMKGYIDAVFEHAGRYYIVDYKSNWLGDSLAEYSPDRLSEAIVESSYDLQYLIYSVALDRMLGWRLGDYSFERHFGGVFYLFLRGMRPSAGPRFGVFFARPDAVTVRRLSETIGSAAAAGGPR